MKRSWDGCLREVVGSRVVDVKGVTITSPKGRLVPIRRHTVAILECGHTHIKPTEGGPGGGRGKAMRVGAWVICTDCRELGDPRERQPEDVR